MYSLYVLYIHMYVFTNENNVPIHCFMVYNICFVPKTKQTYSNNK